MSLLLETTYSLVEMSSRATDPTTATSGSSSSTTTAQNVWPPAAFDNNNNSSACTNQETPSNNIAELAKTIGNTFRGQFIVLPNHLVTFDQVPADDEVSSNSEDCVYAYRGDHQEPIAVDGDLLGGGAGDEAGAGIANGDIEDDETDFLEMDFDPEPNSEQENGMFRDRATSEDDYPRLDHSSLFEQTRSLNEWRGRNEVVREIFEDLPQDESGHHEEVADKVHDVTVEEEKTVNQIVVSDDFDPVLEESDNISNVCSDRSSNQLPPIIPKVTGTKPKVKVQPPSEVAPPPASPVPVSPIIPAIHNNEAMLTIEKVNNEVAAEGVTCLECSELELLSVVAQPSTSKGGRVLSGGSSHCRKHCKKLRNREPSPEPSESPPAAIGKVEEDKNRHIQISPNILDEENILSSFLLLDVELNRERLHELIQASRLSVERTKTIADYLIKFTKANCDPRRFIKLIEKCCPPEIYSQLDFQFQSVSPEFDVLQVPAVEILSRWSSEQGGLRDLSRVANRRFHTSNVLGRVASLLRFQQQCRESEEATCSLASAVVLVPTYHRPGILMISRRENQTKAK